MRHLGSETRATRRSAPQNTTGHQKPDHRKAHTSCGIVLVGILCTAIAASGANRKALSRAERDSIKNLALVCTAPDTPAAAISVPVQSSSLPYSSNPGVGVGGNLALSALDGIAAGLRAASAELAYQKKLSQLMSDSLGEWSFRRAFLSALTAHLSAHVPFALKESSEELSRGDLGKKGKGLADPASDTCLHVHVPTYGLRSQEAGLSVFVKAEMAIVNLRSGKIVAYEVLTFDSIQGPVTEVQNAGTVTRQALSFPLPTTVTQFDRFLADNGRLLKRDLKLAALMISRASVSALGLASGPELNWADEYARRPKDWPAPR